MDKVKTRAGVSVGDHALEVHAGKASHDVRLNGQNVVLGAAQGEVAARSDGCGRGALIPADILHVVRSDLIGGRADDIQARSQHQIGGRPARSVAAVVRVVHLCFGVVAADEPGQRQCVVVVDNGEYSIICGLFSAETSTPLPCL